MAKTRPSSRRAVLVPVRTSRPAGSAALQSPASRLARACAVGLAAAPLVVLASHPLRAQQIDQYLPPNIPGYDLDQGVTVQSRLRPEYEPQNIRVGDVVVRPNLSESLGYNDNVLGTSGHAGSMQIETRAAVAADTDWSRNGLSAYLSVDDFRFPEQPTQNQTNWTASIGGHYEFGRDRLDVAYTHFSLHQSPTDIGSGGIQIPVRYSDDDVRASYRADLGRISLTPSAEFSHYDFSNTTIGDVLVNEQFLNRDVVQAGVAARYEFSPQRDAVVVVNGFNAHFLQQTAGLGQDYYGFSVLGGLEYAANAVVRFRALVGVQQRQYVNASYKTLTEPVAQGSVVWTPTGLTTVTGLVSRAIQDATDQTVTGFTFTSARVVLDHELYRNILLQGYVGIQDADYSGGGGTQTIYTVGANGTWLLNRNLQLVASYDYANSTSDGNSGSAANDALGSPYTGKYTRSIYLLTLKAAL